MNNKTHSQKIKPILLCILDGWGERVLDDKNALLYAHQWQKLKQKYPFLLLNASEEKVGLPLGQMGNSEVGHMTIGLGRVIEQDLPRIHQAVKSDQLKSFDAFKETVQRMRHGSNICHVLGLFSDGGVHSHKDHFMYILNALLENKIQIFIHPILDGRDTHPKAALSQIKELDNWIDQQNPDDVKRGMLCGRFYAMDRDCRWDRIQKATEALISPENLSKDQRFSTFSESIQRSYNMNIFDEFIKPCVYEDFHGIQPNDGMMITNFRSDRVRQISSVFADPQFSAFPKPSIPFSIITGMTEYSTELSQHMLTLFHKIPLHSGLGEIVSKAGFSQLRLAETEKYAHVTYFFNGGTEVPFIGEDRILIPSPCVATYDLKPEMSAQSVVNVALEEMKVKKHQLIVLNFANPDMVGHTGKKDAIIKAVQEIDKHLTTLEQVAFDLDWTLIITADHGNVEVMKDEVGGEHTSHTLSPVPFMIINSKQTLEVSQKSPLSLADIAPTVLELLDLPRPDVMTGKSLLAS